MYQEGFYYFYEQQSEINLLFVKEGEYFSHSSRMISFYFVLVWCGLSCCPAGGSCVLCLLLLCVSTQTSADSSTMEHLHKPLSQTKMTTPTAQRSQQSGLLGKMTFQWPCAAVLLLSALSYCKCSSSENVMNLSNAENIKNSIYHHLPINVEWIRDLGICSIADWEPV